MSVTATQIEWMLEDRDVSFFKNENDSWIIPLSSAYAIIELHEDGELIRFVSSVIGDISQLNKQAQDKAVLHYMQLNDQIKIGRFCSLPKVRFEATLGLEDAELSSDQFHRYLGTTVMAAMDTDNSLPDGLEETDHSTVELPLTPRFRSDLN
ncbi:MAG: hypothetical protein O3B13_22895 [Planctomycetota bacterium]|nr:hypothetical protein [Planctomycetota bacterium]